MGIIINGDSWRLGGWIQIQARLHYYQYIIASKHPIKMDIQSNRNWHGYTNFTTHIIIY
jgi:hypothetical protein